VKIEAELSFETSVTIYFLSQRNIPEGLNQLRRLLSPTFALNLTAGQS